MMIKATNFSFSYPKKDLYDHVSFSIEEGQSCAFIGSSGSGKSTLAKILMNPEPFGYDGELEISEQCNIGYVSQFYDIESHMTVFDYIAQGFHAIEEHIAEICVQMETATDLEPLLEAYQQALDAFEAVEGDNYENNINRKLGLAGLGDKRTSPLNTLSGGEYKLVQVIKQMLTRPHFIIMDEPDAFLDFDNLKALRDLINSHKGTMLTITHSRYLLNHCFDKIIHLENKQIQEFTGSYMDYNFALLEKKIELQELAKADEEEIARNEEMIDRMRFIATNYDYSSNGRVLNARVKIQERLEARRVENPFVCIDKPAISFTTDKVKEDSIPLTVTDLTLSYEDILLEKVNFTIGAGDKVAIIGANGTGKTSLMEAIAKKVEGVTFGEEVELSYLSQDQNSIFQKEDTIYDGFFDIGFPSYDSIGEYLAPFGFTGEKLEQKISTLSGGERNILGLAKLSHNTGNLLILDEPTSHLDTYGQLALEEALQQYKGAVLMISHDFYSIVNCMDYVLILEGKTVRKMQMRKFRKMIYKEHFTVDYLLKEQKKKEIEVKIEDALDKGNFEGAKSFMDGLEKIIAELNPKEI